MSGAVATLPDPRAIISQVLAANAGSPPAPPARVDLPAWAGGAASAVATGTAPGGAFTDPRQIITAALAGKLPVPPDDATSAGNYSTVGGVLTQLAQSPQRALGGLVDLSQGAINLGIRGVNAMSGTQIPPIHGAVGTTAWQQAHGGITPPVGVGERIASAVGNAVTSLPIMAGAGGMLEAAAPRIGTAIGGEGAAGADAAAVARAAGAGLRQASGLSAVAPVAAGAALGQVGAEAVPPAYAPLANLAGNLVGAGGVAGIGAGIGAGARAIGDFAGQMGLGAKETVPVPGGEPVNARASQLVAAGQRIAATGGDTLRQALSADPLQDALDDLTACMASQEAQADPALRAELQGRITAVQSAIASRGSQYETFPGENPMTARLAPTPGMIGGFRAAMSASPDLAEAAGARTAQQNAARLAQIAAMAPAGASPDALGDFFVNGLQNLDQQAAATEERLRPSVQAATEALGGRQAPQQLGEQMTAAVEEQRQPFIAARRALWQAVDPEGNWALPAPTTRQAAADTLGMMTAGAQERMSEVEKSLLNEAATLAPVVRFAELGQLRQDVNAGIRQIGGAEGWQSPGVMRLQRLKAGIDDDIAEAVNQRGQQEAQAVLAGEMAAQDTMAARLRGEANDWLQRQRAGLTGFPAGGNGQAGSGTYPGGGAAGVPGLRGAEVPNAQGYGNAPRYPGVSANLRQPLTPNFPPDAADRYAAAVAKTREEKQRFGQGVTGQILRAGRNGAPFAMLRSDVPGAVVSGGASQPEDLANYLRATGASPAGLRTAQDAVVARLRASGAINPDGIVDTAKLDKWAAKNSETIALVPGLKAALGNARAAQSTLDRATAESRAAVKAFRDGIAKRFLGGRDPGAAVAEALAGRNSAENLDQLITAVRGNDDATRSLQGHVVDFLVNRFSTEGPSSGIGEAAAEGRVLKGAALSKWIADNKAPLKRLFGGQGVQNFEMVTARLRQGAARIPAGTARSAGAHGHGGTPFLLFLGEVLGEHAGGHGLAGMAATYLGKTVLDRMRAAGLKTVNDLVSEAYLHPEVAKALLAKVGPGGTVSTLAAKRIGVTLQAALAADTIGNANGGQTQ